MNKILLALMAVLSGVFIYLSMPASMDVKEIISSYNSQSVNSKSSFESKRVFELAYEKELEKKTENPYGSTPVQGTGEIKSFSYPTVGPPVMLYLQGDPVWKDYPIKPGKVIGPSGCGYTSLAIVCSYFTNTQITPPNICDLAGGRYHTNQGISHQAFFDICANYGLRVKNLGADSWDAADAVLAQGGLLIVSARPGIFTTGGHIMVVRGKTDSGEYLVNNPSDNPTKNHFNMSFSRETMRANIKGIWSVTR